MSDEQYLTPEGAARLKAELEHLKSVERETLAKRLRSAPCPQCGDEHLVIMCPLDHCHCSHDIISGIEYCPLCGEAVCPECGSHDVVQISRVTGYLQEVSGWNAGKQQELKDRARYTVA